MRNKAIQMGSRLFLFADDMIIERERNQKTTLGLLELVTEFVKLQYIKSHKNQYPLYTQTMHICKKKKPVRSKSVSFTIITKRNYNNNN